MATAAATWFRSSGALMIGAERHSCCVHCHRVSAGVS